MMKRRSTSCFKQFLNGGGRITVLPLVFTAAAAFAGEPFAPGDGHQVLEKLPPITDVRLHELANLRARLKGDPGNLAIAVDLASRYSALGSSQDDPRYYAYAQAALHPWLALEQPPVEVRLLRARFLQHQHQFAAALVELEQVLQQSPRNGQARLIQAMILRVLGRYDSAVDSCRSLLTLTDPTVTTVCLTSINSLRGRLAASYRQLQAAAGRVLQPEHAQWAATALAQMAEQLGDAAAAGEHYARALAVNRREVYLLAAYADFLLNQNRPEQVRALLAKETAANPLLLRLAIAERRLGDDRWRRHSDLLRQRFEALRLRGDDRHLREQARAALELTDQYKTGLDLALANWAEQREPEDARLVLQAALSASEPEAAAEVLTWLEANRLEDARLAPLRRQLEETSS